MARIIGAVATSHTPTIGFALDKHKEESRPQIIAETNAEDDA